MPKFTFDWKMRSDERSFDEKNRLGFWVRELNSDWKMRCLCQQNKQRNPAFIEVHRKSPAGETMISGSLEIREEKHQCLLKKKFICLLEEGCLFTSTDLKCSCTTIPSPKVFFLSGEITISARTEASFDFTELVPMTDTDYSSLRQLSNDMQKLLIDKSPLADVSLKCGYISIPAHKSILSARSPVFEGMFRCPMKEAMENEVVIEDVEAPTLQAMVGYMYTGKVEGLSPSFATNLLFIANKYQIMGLESACSKYLMQNMSMKNVATILAIGDLISEDLKKFAIDFVCNKCTDYPALVKSRDWIYLQNKKPALALDIFSAVIKFKEQKLKTLI